MLIFICAHHCNENISQQRTNLFIRGGWQSAQQQGERDGGSQQGECTTSNEDKTSKVGQGSSNREMGGKNSFMRGKPTAATTAAATKKWTREFNHTVHCHTWSNPHFNEKLRTQ
jgi:hypothetical protein